MHPDLHTCKKCEETKHYSNFKINPISFIRSKTCTDCEEQKHPIQELKGLDPPSWLKDLAWCAQMRYYLTNEEKNLFDYWFQDTYGFEYGQTNLKHYEHPN